MTILNALKNVNSKATPGAAMAAGLLVVGAAFAGPTTDAARPAHEAIDIEQRPCRSDMNGDGYVGFYELNMLIMEWGACVDRNDDGPGTGAFELPAEPCAADIDGDGHVGFIDLNMTLNQWGYCGMVTLP